jgi:nucleoside-diphosphate-sugar epimerase
MSTILVFGASGPVGRRLLPRLAIHRVVPVSRTPRDGWLHGDLNNAEEPWPTADAAISLGPLDAFASWLQRHPELPLRRVIALSSMSAQSKQTSTDVHERQVSARLRSSEKVLGRCAQERGIALTIFRPTLIYGDGTDRSLAPIARFVRRSHLLPLPLGATGLRQPVHADDLALAAAAALEQPATHGKTYEMGGGERLAFVALLQRLREATPTWSIPIPIPMGALSALTHFWRRNAPTRAAIARLKDDLVADIAPAQRDFGYAPRGFVAADVLPGAALVYK